MTDRKAFRHDIQVLRGLAVSLVVLFHASQASVPNGFLGVDVFFVISGFLVTSAILHRLDAGRFSLMSFYFSRIRRIIPAVLTTLIVTTLAAYAVLTAAEWKEYLRHLVASLLFSENVLLSRRGGYFGPAPELEPLRHFWSLAVEEQFYLLIPLALLLLPTRWRLRAIALAAALSLLLCVVGSTAAPVLTFYHLPTRAWELLAGALCGFAWIRKRIAPPIWACWLGLGLIVYAALLGVDDVHPRGNALIVVAATSLILVGRDEWLPKNPVTSLIARLGDWSFSLYLLHWPILTFAHLVYVGPLPTWVLGAALALSVGLAALQFKFVEVPFWHHWGFGDRRRWRQLAALVASLAIVSAPAALWSRSETASRVASLRPSTGLAGCRNQSAKGPFPDRCRSGPSPVVAIWGDSFAMHLVDGIRSDPLLADRLLQVTSVACPPTLGLAPLRPNRGIEDAKQCTRFNERAVALLAKSSVRVIVVSSTFGGVLADNGRKVLADGRVVRWNESLKSHFVRAVDILQRSGKTVLIVGPTPREEADLAACNLRKQEGVLLLGRSDCDIRTDALDPSYREIAAALPNVSRAAGAQLLMPAAALCRNGRCSTSADGKLLYRDKGHLSRDGSIFVASAMGLNATLRELVVSHPTQ